MRRFNSEGPRTGSGRLEFDVGYGLATRRGSPFGGRLAVGEFVALSLEGEREEQPGGAEHEVTVHGHLRW